MGKVKIITGEFCSRCHMITPLLSRYAEEHGLEFEAKDINDALPEEFEGAGQLPVIFFGDERVEFDEALARITA